MENTDPISKALELTPLEPHQSVEVLPAAGVTQESQEQIQDDFDYARENLRDVIEKGQQALEGIVSVAAMSQHPRSYEVVATLISSVTNANKDLLELQKKKKDLLKSEETKAGSTTNNLFVGSTADLLKMIKSKNGL